MEQIKDPRFAKVQSDPRFQRAPGRRTRLPVDERFKASRLSALTAKEGPNSTRHKVDKFGRVIDGTKLKNQREKELAEAARILNANKQDSSDEDQDDCTQPVDPDSQEESSSDSGDEDRNGNLESLLPPDEPVKLGKETSRLAVLDLDWSRIRAQDIFAVLHSFASMGTLQRVSIYPSKFGLERMAEEERMGPTLLAPDERRVLRQARSKPTNEADGEEAEVSDSDDQDESEPDDEDVRAERVRQYEVTRLKYFFAVADFSSAEAALAVYEACDGVEFEGSGNVMELRFVPDDMKFDAPIRDQSRGLGDSYEPPEAFITKALQQSKVELSWDEDPPDRIVLKRKRFNKESALEQDLRAYLADSGSSEDEDERNAKRNLLLSACELSDGGADDGRDNSNVEEEEAHAKEMTFDGALMDVAENAAENVDMHDETHWQARLRRARERRKEKKKARQQKAGEGQLGEDEEDAGFQDSFFSDPNAGRSIKTAPRGTVATDEAANQKRQAELELLVMKESGNAGTAAADADSDDEERQTKRRSRSKKHAKSKKKVTKDSEDAFEADPFDPRFDSLFTSSKYAMDPTHPKYKATTTTNKVTAEKLRRRRAQRALVESASAQEKTVDSRLRGENTIQEPIQDVAARLRKKVRRLRK